MSLERVKQRFKQYQKALARLEEGLQADPALDPLIMDGVIQRFEFTFELAWKTLQVYLHYLGVECKSPRSCLKEAYQMGVLEDEDLWLEMLEARNLTAHVYDEAAARRIYEKVRDRFWGALRSLESKLKADLAL